MKILQSNELGAILVGNGVQCDLSIADRQYACPTLGWLAGTFAGALRTFQWQFQEENWKAEFNDCDDFARAAAFYAQWLHMNTPDRPAETALAFGEFWYTRANGEGHAINCAIVEDERLAFFEPQNGMELVLLETEINSCALLRF